MDGLVDEQEWTTSYRIGRWDICTRSYPSNTVIVSDTRRRIVRVDKDARPETVGSGNVSIDLSFYESLYQFIDYTEWATLPRQRPRGRSFERHNDLRNMLLEKGSIVKYRCLYNTIFTQKDYHELYIETRFDTFVNK